MLNSFGNSRLNSPLGIGVYTSHSAVSLLWLPSPPNLTQVELASNSGERGWGWSDENVFGV